MKKRCFIAINLPEKTKDELTVLIKRLKKINPKPVIRYVKPKTIHLTLHFLGYLDERQIEKVNKILQKTAKNYAAGTMITEEIGAFPNFKNPRIIFLAGRQKNGESLIRLRENLGSDLEKIGIKVDVRPWQPHLTIARITAMCQFKTENINLPKLEIPIKTIELMESRLKPYGAEYEIISSYALQTKNS